MAEPCCDTSSFSIDVVLASHQIKHSYALLLVHIYIHNVFPFLILSFYLGSASCTPFLTQLLQSHLLSCFVFVTAWMRHFCQFFQDLSSSSRMEKSLKPRLMLEVAVVWRECSKYCWRRHLLGAGESKSSPFISCSKHRKLEVFGWNCTRVPLKIIILTQFV